jgi:rod shape-determining protein MreD
MTEARLTRRIVAGAAFAGIAAAMVLVKLLPLGLNAGGWPVPDLLMCLLVAWMIRRPDLLPMPLVAAVFLWADMMLMRPPGLWAALAVLAGEWLRNRQRGLRAAPLVAEPGLLVALMVAMVLAHWAVLALLFVDQPRLGQQLLQVPVTVLAYPVVAALLQLGLGLRRRPVVEGFGRRAVRP